MTTSLHARKPESSLRPSQLKGQSGTETKCKWVGNRPQPTLSAGSLYLHISTVRCDTLSVESQLQGKRLRWLGQVFRMPNDRLPKKLLFREVKGFRPPRPRAARLVIVIVKTVILVGLTGTHKTGCSGETRLVLHVPNSS